MSGLRKQILSPENLAWRNGVPYSERFDDIYSSHSGSVEESRHVFLHLNNLPTRWVKAQSFKIGEIGFGIGTNFLTTVKEWLSTSNENSLLHFWSVEKHPLAKSDLQRVLINCQEIGDLVPLFIDRYPALIKGTTRIVFPEWRVILTLSFLEALDALKSCESEFDAWYLDGFSPNKNPDLWSKEIFSEINRLSHAATTLSTYSVASIVRENLAASGFSAKKVGGFGDKSESLVVTRKEKLPVSSCSPPWFAPPAKIEERKDAIVIGAGLAGSAAAFSLALRGFHVTVIESARSIASGASGNPQGAVTPYLSADPSKMSRFYLQGFSGATAYLAALSTLSQTEVWKKTGSLQLPSSERLRSLIDLIRDEKLNPEFVRCVDQKEASNLSALSLKSDAAYFPEAGYAKPNLVCELALSHLKDRVKVLLNMNVSSLDFDGDVWAALNDKRSIIASSAICVVANGMGASKYTQTSWLPLEPVRGQICLLPASQSAGSLKSVLCYDGYVFPQESGRQLLGATYEHGNLNPTPSDENNRELISRLENWIGPFTTLNPVESRVSFRVSTHDRLPYIGALPNSEQFIKDFRDLNRGFPWSHYPKVQYLPGLYASLGHGSRGLISTWLAGEIIGSLVCGEALPLERELIEAVNPVRFLVKQLNKVMDRAVHS